MAFGWRARGDAHSPEPERLPWKDYAPPEAQAVDKMIAHFRPQPTGPRHCIPITERESEVMPPDRARTREDAERRTIRCQSTSDLETQTYDMRPASATRANPLDEIKELVKSLTYGEMMDLAAAIWKAHDESSQEAHLTHKA